jgi:hypothetical protein
MKQSRLKPEDIEWIKEHPKEFIKEFQFTVNTLNKVSHLLEPYRVHRQKEEYKKRFKELLRKERENHGRTNK